MKLKTGKKSGLKYFNIQDIRSWYPCYDPIKHLKEDWRGTAIDILKNDSIPFVDRLWVVCRNELVSDKLMRLFAVWCYRETLKVIPNQDPRSVEAVNTAERHAHGLATDEELSAAREAAWDAEFSAAWVATSSVAYSAASLAAWSAASTAEPSSRLAAADTAWSVAREAIEVARVSAYSTSAWQAQRDKLIRMIEAEGKERVVAKEIVV